MISGPFQATLFIVITSNPESNCTCREKNHSQFHCDKDVTRATSTTLDVMLERRMDDCWDIEGNRNLSDSWTGLTRFTILDERRPDGCTVRPKTSSELHLEEIEFEFRNGRAVSSYAIHRTLHKVFTSPSAISYVTSLMSGTPSPGTCAPSLTVMRPTSTDTFSYDPLLGEI